MLLLVYFTLDRVMHARESPDALARDAAGVEPLTVLGKRHVLFLGMVVASVAFVPSLDLHAITDGDASFVDWVPWRSSPCSRRWGSLWESGRGSYATRRTSSP